MTIQDDDVEQNSNPDFEYQDSNSYSDPDDYSVFDYQDSYSDPDDSTDSDSNPSFKYFDYDNWEDIEEPTLKSSIRSTITERMQDPYDHTNTEAMRDRFISLVNEIPVENKSLISWVLFTAFSEGAIDYAAIILEGQTGHEVDVNMMPESGFTLLHSAACILSSEVTEWLLQRGAGANIKNCNPGMRYNLGCVPFEDPRQEIPLESALRHRCFRMLDCDQSTIAGILYYLCLPKMEGALKTVRLLAEHTTDVGHVAYSCIKNQDLTAFATLLLVAQKKVMVLKNKEADICQDFMIEIGYIINKIQKLSVEGKSRKCSRKLETRMFKLKSLIFGLLLIEVFERVGDAFDKYLQSERGGDVTEEVSTLLSGLDFKLNYDDIDLSFTNSVCHQPIVSVLEYIASVIISQEENKSTPMYPPQVPQYSKTGILSNQKQDSILARQNEQRRSMSTCFPHHCTILSSSGVVQRQFHTVKTTCDHSKFPTTMEAQLLKTTKGVEHHVTSSASIKKWVSFALRLKRGLRCG